MNVHVGGAIGFAWGAGAVRRAMRRMDESEA